MVTLQLPAQKAQTASNLHRWAELRADRVLAKFEGRIETDRHGHIIMSFPPAPRHGSMQFEIGRILSGLTINGRIITEFPVSTADGVKATDVAWASPERLQDLGDQACFPTAPEICIEVMSPGNTEAEMSEKLRLYFDAGAREVWLCGQDGVMRFFNLGAAEPLPASRLFPRFPNRVELR
jgi:Uma2 family endonuclease